MLTHPNYFGVYSDTDMHIYNKIIIYIQCNLFIYV